MEMVETIVESLENKEEKDSEEATSAAGLLEKLNVSETKSDKETGEAPAAKTEEEKPDTTKTEEEKPDTEKKDELSAAYSTPWLNILHSFPWRCVWDWNIVIIYLCSQFNVIWFVVLLIIFM